MVNDPRNPLAKYQKAVVLAAEERYEEALAELEELKALAPKEATVFFLMGACQSGPAVVSCCVEWGKVVRTDATETRRWHGVSPCSV